MVQDPSSELSGEKKSIDLFKGPYETKELHSSGCFAYNTVYNIRNSKETHRSLEDTG